MNVRHLSRSTVWLTSCLLVLSGCGLATYEERLARTADFYAYLEQVDENLTASAWIRPSLGMAMRLPKPFAVPMAGPEKVTDALGEEGFGPDPRQETPIGFEIPGLIDAWQETLGEGEEPDTWFYILSNHDRFVQETEGGPAAGRFFDDLEAMLATAFNVAIPNGEQSQPGPNSRFRHLTPPRGSPQTQYTTSKDYTAIFYSPEEPVNERHLHGRLYERTAGDVQAAVLVIGAPEGLSQYQFRQRVDMALATLSIDPQTVRRGRNTAPTTPSSGTPQRPGGTSGF